MRSLPASATEMGPAAAMAGAAGGRSRPGPPAAEAAGVGRHPQRRVELARGASGRAEHAQEGTAAVVDVDAVVAGVGDIHVARPVDGDAAWVRELPWLHAV